MIVEDVLVLHDADLFDVNAGHILAEFEDVVVEMGLLLLHGLEEVVQFVERVFD